MRNLLYIAAALATISALYISGILNTINLTHPIWRINATLYGSLAGAALSVLLFWACAAKPRLGRGFERLVMLAFVIILPITLFSAKIFIDASEFNAVAVNIWHKGSYAVFLTFIPAFAALLAKLRIIGSPPRG